MYFLCSAYCINSSARGSPALSAVETVTSSGWLFFRCVKLSPVDVSAASSGEASCCSQTQLAQVQLSVWLSLRHCEAITQWFERVRRDWICVCLSLCVLVIYQWAVWALSSLNIDGDGERMVSMAAEKFKVSSRMTKQGGILIVEIDTVL